MGRLSQMQTANATRKAADTAAETNDILAEMLTEQRRTNDLLLQLLSTPPAHPQP